MVRTKSEIFGELRSIFAEPPSHKNFRKILLALEEVDDPQELISYCQDHLAAWPNDLRDIVIGSSYSELKSVGLSKSFIFSEDSKDVKDETLFDLIKQHGQSLTQLTAIRKTANTFPEKLSNYCPNLRGLEISYPLEGCHFPHLKTFASFRRDDTDSVIESSWASQLEDLSIRELTPAFQKWLPHTKIKRLLISHCPQDADFYSNLESLSLWDSQRVDYRNLRHANHLKHLALPFIIDQSGDLPLLSNLQSLRCMNRPRIVLAWLNASQDSLRELAITTQGSETLPVRDVPLKIWENLEKFRLPLTPLYSVSDVKYILGHVKNLKQLAIRTTFPTTICQAELPHLHTLVFFCPDFSVDAGRQSLSRALFASNLEHLSLRGNGAASYLATYLRGLNHPTKLKILVVHADTHEGILKILADTPYLPDLENVYLQGKEKNAELADAEVLNKTKPWIYVRSH